MLDQRDKHAKETACKAVHIGSFPRESLARICEAAAEQGVRGSEAAAVKYAATQWLKIVESESRGPA